MITADASRPPHLPLAPSLWVGVDRPVPVADGRQLPYVNLDNAASTPALRVVRDKVDQFLEWYASVHRGAGYKSQLSTHAYEAARATVGRFVRADEELDRVIFAKHTTEAVNLLAAACPPGADGLVALSIMEHHSNMLPWRRAGAVAWVEVDDAGRLDLASLEAVLAEHRGAVRLVAISGASNVTGYVNPVHEIARIAHRHGARILVDCAQLAAHRPIDMRPHDDPAHLDFVVFSGHKVYAPYGVGVLVGPREILDAGAPLLVGGGAVKLVTRDRVLWEEAPDLDEAGSPNVVGAVALGVALETLTAIGFDAIDEAEQRLAAQVLRGLQRLPAVTVLGSPDPERLDDRLGVVTFDVAGLHHSFVASVLANEWGIGVRDGCFCAHPYLIRLLGIEPPEIDRVMARVEAGDRAAVPGAVRVSVAPYNAPDDIERFLTALEAIVAGRVQLRYGQDVSTGDYAPLDWDSGYADAFALAG